MDNAEDKTLRELHRPLVIAAERVMEGVIRADRSEKVKKAQLTHLVSVCTAASCAEEIASYIRYQASRKPGNESLWELAHARQTLAAIEEVFKGVKNLSVAGQVEAWRLYATYLMRAFTYQFAVARSNAGAAGTHGR